MSLRLNLRVLMGHLAVLAPLLVAASLLGLPLPRVALLALLGIVLALIAASVLATRLSRPLHEMMLGAQQVAAGDFKPLTAQEEAGDLALLAESFNQMVESLRSRDSQLQALNDELSRRLRELHALFEVSRSVNSSLDVQQVLRTILNETVRTFPTAKKGLIHLLDEDGVHLTPFALSDTEGQIDPSMGLSVDQGIAGRVIRERRAITVPDTSQDPSFVDLGSNVRSLMVTPLQFGNHIIGALSLDSDQRNAFTPDMEETFRALANRAASALENARLYEESQKRVSELTALYHTALELARGERVEALAPRIVALAIELLDAEGGRLLISESAPQRLRVRHVQALADSTEGDEVTHGEGLAGRVAEEGEALSTVEGGARVAAPLIWEGAVLGVVEIVRQSNGNRFQPAEQRLLTLFAQQAAGAMQNANLLAALQDKTHELEAANHDLARASQLKSEFLANMSHELRTPLNSILGFSEILVDQTFGPLNDRQLRYLSNIYTSGQHLLDLINDILDLSKIEAGRMELMLEPFRLEGALQEIYAVIEPLAAKKDLAVQVDTSAAPERIVADRLRFKQVLYNIVSNAVKFTPESGAVDIRAWRENGTLYIAVRDSGIGIPPDQVEQIFDVFHRLDRSYRRETEGTGLGLALVRRFLELHGGDVSVESTVGEGSTFTICLPQDDAMVESLQTLEGY